MKIKKFNGKMKITRKIDFHIWKCFKEQFHWNVIDLVRDKIGSIIWIQIFREVNEYVIRHIKEDTLK